MEVPWTDPGRKALPEDSHQGEGGREEAQSGGLLQVGVLSHLPSVSAHSTGFLSLGTNALVPFTTSLALGGALGDPPLPLA